MVGANTCGDGELELLRLREALGGEVARVESAVEGYLLALGGNGGAEATYGVVMIISASTSSWSNLEFSPSLSDVVTRVCP